MANVVKKDGGQQAQGAPVQGQQPQTQPQNQPQQGTLMRRDPFAMSRDPFQMMMRDPFQVMRDPFQVMREMMIDPFRMLGISPWLGRGEVSWSPTFEVRETDDAFVFKADLPGVRNEDLEITLTGNQLQISGKREHEQEQGEGQFYTYERSYGNFVRAFALPESADLDNIRSELKDGVLTLVVPKKAGSAPQRRKIPISAGGTGSKS